MNVKTTYDHVRNGHYFVIQIPNNVIGFRHIDISGIEGHYKIFANDKYAGTYSSETITTFHIFDNLSNSIEFYATDESGTILQCPQSTITVTMILNI